MIYTSDFYRFLQYGDEAALLRRRLGPAGKQQTARLLLGIAWAFPAAQMREAAQDGLKELFHVQQPQRQQVRPGSAELLASPFDSARSSRSDQ